MIQDRATHGRRLLKQLIIGRLDLTPNLEGRYYDFRGTGTLLPVIAGVVPQSVASLLRLMREAIALYLEELRAAGEPIPEPTSVVRTIEVVA